MAIARHNPDFKFVDDFLIVSRAVTIFEYDFACHGPFPNNEWARA